jgi:chitinase
MGRQGIGCNVVSPNDTSNFLAFLKEFKADPVGSRIPLSAAVPITPFRASDGNPAKNVSEFAHYLDYITIMNYDIWGSWSSAVGPNAPLNDSCAAPANQQGSAVFAVNQWTNAGFPIGQIALGLASYGHSFYVKPSDAFPNGSTTLAAYPPFNATIRPVGDSWDVDGGTFDKCGALQPNGGNWNFRGLVATGLLDENGNNVTDVPFRFDNCSQTVFFFHALTFI